MKSFKFKHIFIIAIVSIFIRTSNGKQKLFIYPKDINLKYTPITETTKCIVKFNSYGTPKSLLNNMNIQENSSA